MRVRIERAARRSPICASGRPEQGGTHPDSRSLVSWRNARWGRCASCARRGAPNPAVMAIRDMTTSEAWRRSACNTRANCKTGAHGAREGGVRPSTHARNLKNGKIDSAGLMMGQNALRDPGHRRLGDPWLRHVDRQPGEDPAPAWRGPGGDPRPRRYRRQPRRPGACHAKPDDDNRQNRFSGALYCQTSGVRPRSHG